jgi:hypothetical protein
VSNNPFPTTASESGQSSFDTYHLSSNDDEYLMINTVAVMTLRHSDCVERLMTATRLNVNSPPEAPKNRVHRNSNRNHYHSDTIEIRSTSLVPDITDWWNQQEETQSKYANLSNVARIIFRSYHKVSKWRPVFPLHETLADGGSQKPHARRSARRSL